MCEARSLGQPSPRVGPLHITAQTPDSAVFIATSQEEDGADLHAFSRDSSPLVQYCESLQCTVFFRVVTCEIDASLQHLQTWIWGILGVGKGPYAMLTWPRRVAFSAREGLDSMGPHSSPNSVQMVIADLAPYSMCKSRQALLLPPGTIPRPADLQHLHINLRRVLRDDILHLLPGTCDLQQDAATSARDGKGVCGARTFAKRPWPRFYMQVLGGVTSGLEYSLARIRQTPAPGPEIVWTPRLTQHNHVIPTLTSSHAHDLYLTSSGSTWTPSFACCAFRRRA